MNEQSAEHKCGLCGEPMPPGEEMFAYHGFSGSCPKPRELTRHQVPGMPEALKIEVRDKPGAGGANYRYDIVGFDTDNNPSSTPPDGYKSSFSRLPVIFQNGPIKEAGVNGVTNEALLAIVEDRLKGFQRGPFACEANAMALAHVELALACLRSRTAERAARGVEGTQQV
jgi:hypothetical protein